MVLEMLEREDLSVYIVSGVPKSFKKKLVKYLSEESDGEGGVMLLDDEMTDWVLARVKGEKRRNHEQTPASAALWRAFRALSAARYHLNDEPTEARVRELRSEIEELWRSISPIHAVSDEDDSEE